MGFRGALLALAVFATVLVTTSSAEAYPWMIRHAYFGCGTCHADPSGGELLTAYGRVQGDLVLRMRYGKDNGSAAASEPADDAGSFDSFESFDTSDSSEKKEPAPAAESKGAGYDKSAGFLWGLVDLPDWLLLGGSYRHATLLRGSDDLRTFPMQLDVYGQIAVDRFHAAASVGAARVPEGSPFARQAQVTSNQEDGWNLISRTHWVGADIDSDRKLTLRAGRLNLPFGLRIPEHIAWVRSATRTDRESAQQHGLALSLQESWLRGEVMAIAGNYQIRPDRFRERGYSVYAEALASDGLALGASSKFTVAQADVDYRLEKKTSRGAHGAFGRVRVAQPVVVMAEANVLDTARRDVGYVGFLQLDVELVQGLHFGGSGEVLDQGYADVAELADLERQPGNGKPRFGAWGTIDWFFLPHFEARFDLIARQEDELWLFGQLHFYL